MDTQINVSFGLRNFKKGATIICSIHSLDKLRISTGITIPAGIWDEERQRCVGKLPIAAKINSRLSELERGINDTLIEGMTLGETKPQLKARALAILGKEGRVKDNTQLFPFFYDWAKHGTATKLRYDRQNFYSYRLLKSILPEDITFSEIDYNTYTTLLRGLREHGLKENSIGQHIKNLKAVMNEAYKRGLHTNTAFLQFRKPSEETDAVYLTGEELQKIKDLQVEGHLAKARDLFLLGCYTAMRFSDYSRIRKDWIKDNNIVFTEEKTGNRNLIPLSPAAREIITRYKGAPRLSQQKLNEYIKEVCKLAGITDKVELTYTKGGMEVRRAKPKCDLVSTHTARRTGATLLVKAGAPIAWVMKVTGHKSEKTFMRYIRLSSEEYAELVRSYVDAL